MDVVIDTLPAVRKDYLILFHKDNTITNKRNNKKTRLYYLRQFGIRKFAKRLIVSLLFCVFIVENQ